MFCYNKMNNREFNSFSKNLNTYKNFVPATTLKKLSNRVKSRRLEPGNALVKAYNQASVNYKEKTWKFYGSLLKSTGVKYATNSNFRKIVSNAMSQLPKQPPCIPHEGGKSGIRKSGEAIAKMCGSFCVRRAQGVGRTAKSIVGLGTKNTRVEQIRNRVRTGVLNNLVQNNKNNMRSIINNMPEKQLRKLAKEKQVKIPNNLNKLRKSARVYNTRSKINTISKNQFRNLARDRQVTLARA
jgi:hypothetical protein